MKILLINNYPFRKGGAESVFFNTSNLLKSKGHQVITFSREIKNHISEQVDYLIPEEKFFFSRFYSFQSKKIISKILKVEKPDIVHIHNIVGGISFSILPEIKRNDIPVVATIHDFRLLCPVSIMVNGKGDICEKCKSGKYYNAILNKCHPEGLLKSSIVAFESYLRDTFIHHKKYFDAYIFVSNFTKEKFLEAYPEISSKSFVLYNFNQNFDSTIYRGNYFLYFGRLDREKGLITLLQAFNQLSDYRLIIAGRGPFERYIDEYNQYGNISFVGFKQGEELKELIKNSEFVIIPSECYENLPMSVVEALSLSKPIIVSGLGGLKELINNSKAGYEFNPKSVKDLVDVIKKAKSTTENEYFQLAEKGFQFAQREFDQENYYNKLLKIYEQLINSR